MANMVSSGSRRNQKFSHSDSGLIRYKIVIHAFIDGFSRFVTGIQAVNNNCAATVAALFHKARAAHGTPSRVCGDHGVENVQVAAAMTSIRGFGRGSYIWGRYVFLPMPSTEFHTPAWYRSIHNTRIERLWYDVTSGFGAKWKDLFLALEHNDGLNPSLPSHVWILHYLFLPAIQEDALQWAAAWNCHRMQICGERSRSPEDMFVAGILQRGARGLDLRPVPSLEEDVGDIHQYGVDWAVHCDTRLMCHLHENNTADQDSLQSFSLPEHMARVECKPPNNPFTGQQMEVFWARLLDHIGDQVHRRDMASRRIVWRHAFAIVSEIRLQR
jgi:hypothetical protein